MYKVRYHCCTAYHRSTLKECLETEKPITLHLARMLLKLNIYRFYAYDERIKANRYLIYNIDGNLGMPTWLHFYLD